MVAWWERLLSTVLKHASPDTVLAWTVCPPSVYSRKITFDHFTCKTDPCFRAEQKRCPLLNETFFLHLYHFNHNRLESAVPPMYFWGVEKKSNRFHLVTARKWGGSRRETEQYQYLRSASLIPSKQAVIGMFAVIFHVGLLISPPNTRIPSLRRPDHFIETSQRCPWCVCQKGKLFAIHLRKWVQTGSSESQENRLMWRLGFLLFSVLTL